MSKTEFITKNEQDNENSLKRERAQKIAFAKIQELMQRNVNKNKSKTFTQYTKDLIKRYLASPSTNIDSIRQVSRFLARNSMIYKKMIYYYSTAPLFLYSLIQESDLSKEVKVDKSLKGYMKVLKTLDSINMRKEFSNTIATAFRDGISVNYVYDNSDGSAFFMPLDPQYCRIYGKTQEGEWIVYYNAAFFDAGDNKEFIYGVNDDNVGVWDEVFKKGYEDYKSLGTNFQWFRLPPEKTHCLICGNDDEFDMPLPFLSGIFVSLLDLIDLEQILADRTELENYILLVSKLPLISNSEDVDDFSVSIDLAEYFNNLLEDAVPELCGVAFSPMDIQAIKFDKANNSENVDKLASSYNNLFNNAGMSQLVVAGGASTNSIGLNHAIENDMSTVWVHVDRIESWLNFYIKNNIADGYKFKFHHINWYNRDNYIKNMKEMATLGGDPISYFVCVSAKTPYQVICETRFNFETLQINKWLRPLSSTYTQSSDVGAPTKSEDELTEEGINTRDGDKNQNTTSKVV